MTSRGSARHSAGTKHNHILSESQAGEYNISNILHIYIMLSHTIWEATYITIVHKLVNNYKLLSHTNYMQSKVATIINVSKTLALMLPILTSYQIVPSESQSFLTDQLLLGHIHIYFDG